MFLLSSNCSKKFQPEFKSGSELVLAEKRHRVRDDPIAWQVAVLIALEPGREPLTMLELGREEELRKSGLVVDENLANVVAADERLQVELLELRDLGWAGPACLDRLEPLLIYVAAGHACQVDHLVLLLNFDIQAVALSVCVWAKVGLVLAEFVTVKENANANRLERDEEKKKY